MEPILQVNEIVQSYYASQQIQVPANCCGYLAVNKGDAIVWINGFELLPPSAPGLSGESTGLLCNRLEIFKGDNGNMRLVVDKAVGVNPRVQIVFKYYINLC